jgi:pimeloyl-ACP methyl ester carboxylesterase
MPYSQRIPVTVEGQSLHIAVDIHVPERDVERAATHWYCLPGGSFSRQYFDLKLGADDSRSFAATMTRRGDIVVTIDPIGVGESDQVGAPHGFDLEFIVKTHGAAIAAVERGLLEGTLGLPPLPRTVRIGVGHSMGGFLLMLQQASFANFDGTVLLGSGTGGLDVVLTEAERHYSRDPKATRAAIADLAKARWGIPFPEFKVDSQDFAAAFAGETPAWSAAIARTSSRLLATTATFCLIPDSAAPDAASIKTPVLLAFGDADLPLPPYEAPKAFTGSPDITLVILPKTGHMHFGFASAPALFMRLAHWSALCSKVAWQGANRGHSRAEEPT